MLHHHIVMIIMGFWVLCFLGFIGLVITEAVHYDFPAEILSETSEEAPPTEEVKL